MSTSFLAAAASQTTDASPEAHRYFSAAALLASVQEGDIAPLSGRWIAELHGHGGRLCRRQDLPSEAFLSASDLHRLVSALADDWGLLFVALSYKWLSRAHPDPEGFHLAIVGAVAQLYLKPGESPLTEAFERHNISAAADFALFWDFAVLHQPPRTESKTDQFKRGLNASDVWYGHSQSVVWMQKELLPSFEGTPYEDSGWCFFESVVSATIKVGGRRLDLAKRTELAMGLSYGREDRYAFHRLDSVCASHRLPPPLPETIRHQLVHEKHFNYGSDASNVAEIYRRFFVGVTTTTRHLDFSELNWGVTEAIELITCLPRFVALTDLDIRGNDAIVGDAAQRLAAAVLSHASLRQFNEIPMHELRTLASKATGLDLSYAGKLVASDFSTQIKRMGPTGGLVLSHLLDSYKPSLKSIDLFMGKIGDEAMRALVGYLSTTPSLTFIQIGGNGCDHVTACCLLSALTDMHVRSLGMSGCSLGIPGGKQFAQLLTSTESLVSVELNHNQLLGPGSPCPSGGRSCTDLSAADAIANALLANHSVQDLNLEGCSLPIKRLKGHDTVATLDLSNKGLSALSGAIIAKLVTYNSIMQCLNLEFNTLGPAGGAALVETLGHNMCLTDLNVRIDGMGDGAK